MNMPIQWSEVPLFEAVEYDDTGHAYRHDMPPGTAKWSKNHDDSNPHAALVYMCPCGCGHVGAIPVCRDTKVDRAWLWDGNVEKPTLSPSIQKLSTCRWHGYLKAGVWEKC